MKRRIGLCALMIAASVAIATAFGRAQTPATDPASQTTPLPLAAKTSAPAAPTTAPSTGVIRGTVTIDAEIGFQKADLSRVVVYLASTPALDAAPLPAQRRTVSQRNKTFTPNFLVVARGSDVEFPNWDKFDHNVFSRSKAAPAFDLDRYPYGQSKTRNFDKVGVVQVFCNIHPQMRAIIYVTPNIYFTRPDAAGNFELANVPPGQYQVVAWQERCEEQRDAVRVDPAGAAHVSFRLGENRQSILANDPPVRHGAYGVDRGLGVKRERLDLPVVRDAHPAPAQDEEK